MLAWFLGILGLSGAGIGIAALLGGGPWMLEFAAAAMKGAETWLSKRSLGEIVAIVVGIALAVDHIALLASHRHSAKVEAQLAKAVAVNHSLQAQLDAISSKKNTQAVVTKTNIVTVTKVLHDADVKAKKVETAPLPGQCKSPPEVLGADL